jgi:hypothetical protein
MIDLPVNTFDEAIARYGERVGAPELNEYFINIERGDTFTLDRTEQNISLDHRPGAASLTLYRRVVGSESVPNVIVGLPVAKYFNGGVTPQRSNLGGEHAFEASFFDKSENESFAEYDAFTSSGD